MTENTTTNLKSWFEEYSRPYRSSDNNALAKTSELKYDHTLQVVGEMELLTHSLSLADDACRLACVIALFHDLGRFEQFRKYNTLSDRMSVDHSELGVSELRRHKVLCELDDESVRIVEDAILAHNKLAIPGEYNGDRLFYTQLIRDADKLDILRVFIDVDQNNDREMLKKAYVELDESDTVNPEVLAFFERRELVRIEHLRSRNDMRLMILSWVFDLNFAHSLRRFRDRVDAEYLLSHLPDTPGVQHVRQQVSQILTDPKNHG
ncbi:HD domain protein [bacterium BMS3Bbin04]|nr:HD domain protein [bacterium BMS3Bbin04]